MSDEDIIEFLECYKEEPVYKNLLEIITAIDRQNASVCCYLFGTLTYSILYLLTCKLVNDNVTTEYYHRWYKAMMASCAAGGFHEVRRDLFLGLRSYVISNAGLYSSVYKVVLHYITYTEMTHMELICNYLLRDFPELMSLGILIGYRASNQGSKIPKRENSGKCCLLKNARGTRKDYVPE